MADNTSTIDKILERLPYSDGSLRRRFVSGGIVLVGVLIAYFEDIKPFMEEVGYGDLLTSPIIAFACLLLIYALGNVVDMIGEIFFVRAASGVFWAISFPNRHWQKSKHIFRFLLRYVLGIFLVPLLIIINIVKGLIGYTSYKTEIESSLSEKAKNLYSSLPAKVALGLSEPVGDNAEIAWKYIIEQFDKEIDQKWARRFISRAKDVLAVTTALVIIFLSLVFFHIYGVVMEGPGKKVPENIVVGYRTDISNAIHLLSDERVKRKFLILEPYDPGSWFPYRFAIEIEEMVVDPDIEETDRDQLMKIKRHLDDMNSAILSWKYDQYRKEFTRWMMILASIVIFMLSYVAFFITIRNAVVSILEILAIKKETPYESK